MEDALVRLDRLTQEEVRMAAAQGLKVTHVVHEEVKSVDGHIQQVNNRVQDISGDVQQVDTHVQGVDDKVQGVDNKVQRVDDKIQGVDDKIRGVDDKIQDVDNKVQQVTDRIGDQKRSSSNNFVSLALNPKLLSQGISYERTSETGSLLRIRL